MGWIANLLGATPHDQLKGLELGREAPQWSVQGPKTFSELFRALQGWLPDGAILYFEGGYPRPDIEAFMAQTAIPEQTHLAIGTIWPRPRVFHVPAQGNLGALAELMDRHAEPELAIHFHVYAGEKMIIEWNDAFIDPIRVNATIPAQHVKALADALGTSFARENG